MNELIRTLEQKPASHGPPMLVVANTTKGRGVSLIEDNAAWHHRVPTDEELRLALEEIDGEERNGE